MPSNEHGVREITEPVQLSIVGDRMHFTLVSGPCARTYSISFHRARGAMHLTGRLLDEHDRRIAEVRPLRRKGAAKGH
jgi:hypothetical protein